MQKYWGALLVLLFLACGTEEKPTAQKAEMVEIPEKVEPVKAIEFGFALEDFKVHQDTVKNGDSFGELMLKSNVAYPKIAEVSEKFRDTFDVRKIRVGKPYLILKSKDTLETAQAFIYQNDPINYTIVDFRDTVKAYKYRKEVKYVDREASGVIKSSLYVAINEQNIDQNITYALADIYAWTIDFFKLSEGDKFKVLYKERYINDTIYAGSEPIEAAYFEHNGVGQYAFPYENDSLKNVIDYFDDEANNLRRTFLRAPVKFSRISSKYNLKRRIRYYGYRVRPHKGTDYAAHVGTPIMATADGIVTESRRKGGNGKYVKIRHNGTYSTQYLHMKNQNVKRGDFVRQGDVIGWVGMTGNTGGPHVCYRFWRNDRQVDPLKEELPAAEPLPEELRPAYYEYINPLKTQLDCIEYHIVPDDEMLTLN